MDCDKDDKHCDDTKRAPDGSLLQSLKTNSMKSAGYAYLIGDAALATAGILSGDKKVLSSGVLWWLGGLGAARYGNPNTETRLKLLGQKLGDYLRKQGVEIPSTPSTELLAQENGIIDHVERFFYEHPSELLNAMYALGAVQLMQSGIKGKSFDRKASGALVAAGALAGLLIHEKAPSEHHPPQNILAKMVSWAQEKPLRISGSLYWLNNIFLFKDAVAESKINPTSGAFRFITAGTYIFANTMLSLTSKKMDASDSQPMEAMQQLADIAAHIITAQPPQAQNALIEQISGYLAAQPETSLKAEEISKILHNRLRTSIKKDSTANSEKSYNPNKWRHLIAHRNRSASDISL